MATRPRLASVETAKAVVAAKTAATAAGTPITTKAAAATVIPIKTASAAPSSVPFEPEPVVSAPKASSSSTPPVLPSPAPTVAPKVEPIKSSPVEMFVSKITGQPTQAEVKIAEVKASAPTVTTPISRQQQTAMQTPMTWQQAFEEKPMTKAEVIQYGTQETKEAIQQIEKQKQTIEPSATYLMEGKPTPGFIVSAKLNQMSEEMAQSDKVFVEQIQKQPEGTKFIGAGKEGFSIIQPPEDKYKQMKEEFNKIEQAYEINPVLGAVTELGYGAASSLQSVGDMLAGVIGKVDKNLEAIYRVTTKTPKQYYPTLYDVALDTEGAKIWGKHPIFTSGAIFGETLQLAAFDASTAPITAAGKTTIKAGIKKVPPIITKTSEFSPKLVNIGKKIIPAEIKETTFAKNLYNWGAKGYTVGKETIPVLKGTIQKGEITVSEYVYKPGKRIFISPESQEKFASTIAKSGKIDITFPTSKTFGTGKKAISVIEMETYGRTPILGRLTRKYTSSVLEREFNQTSRLVSSKLSDATKGSFIRGIGVQPKIDVGIARKGALQEAIEKGYPSKFTRFESGGIFSAEWEKGFGTAFYKEPKPWISKLEQKIAMKRLSKTGMQSLLPQISKRDLIIATTRQGIRKAPIKGVKFLVPSTMKGISIVGIGMYSISKTMKYGPLLTKQIVKMDDVNLITYEKISIPMEKKSISIPTEISTKQIPTDYELSRYIYGRIDTKPGVIQIGGTLKQPSVEERQIVSPIPRSTFVVETPTQEIIQSPKSDMIQKPETIPSQVPSQIITPIQTPIKVIIPRLAKASAVKTSRIQSGRMQEITTSRLPPILLPKIPTAYGRGQKGMEFNLFGEKYRFRGALKFNPIKELNEMKVKLKVR